MGVRFRLSNRMTSDVARHTVHTLVFRSLKRTHDTFIAYHGCLPDNDKTAEEMKKSIKTKQEYLGVERKKKLPSHWIDRLQLKDQRDRWQLPEETLVKRKNNRAQFQTQSQTQTSTVLSFQLPPRNWIKIK